MSENDRIAALDQAGVPQKGVHRGAIEDVGLARDQNGTHNNPMKKADAISRLHRNAQRLRSMGAASLYLFGSTARDKARSDSDIDIFIEPVKNRPFSLVDLIRMRDFLRRSLGSDVDLTTRRSLHPALRKDIHRSAVKVF
ncbi:conserved protein of unknown function [Candidatus Filomicrobium marinum]|uniref:Polymerase nucleotidyl transferase domain-containing protein n=1 Tax=Candidatus Filomicrobium marinum TaxID=1608628 RepID=A0A0D6JBT4_9HYPH|nr:nucleotidyltransferase domain-containing protein [Candidatus Filomicrobium marinum]CFX04324.1 conserved protein of unknown function [Candidatus Filomicrobium marinum]CPR16024.1 conserved protein of unknown function [Candidatus Filomicrobium marinum]